MPKFSIIVPVYNVEKYIEKCLNSIFNQSFKDYEVIVVNDGTKDNSMDIVNKFDVKVINQKNQGLSEARNSGVKAAHGDYLVFIDSDDYIEKDLLKNINKSLENNPDVVRYQVKDIIEDKEILYNENEFTGKSGEEAFELITKYHYFEPAWLYSVRRKYYIDNKYSFKKGTYHEDFGLTPLLILKAKIVNSIDYCGYCYVQRSGSIMTSNSREKMIKKVDDTFIHYNYLIKEADKTKLNTQYFKSFISNSLILKVTELKGEDYKKYKQLLKDKKVYDNLLEDSIGRKIKKSVVKRAPKLLNRCKRK